MTILEALKQLRNDLKLWVTNNLNVKVSKEDGKGLSTNNFVDGEQIRFSHLYGAIPAGTVFYEDKATLSTTTIGQNERLCCILEGIKAVSIINNDNYFIDGYAYTLTVNGVTYTCPDAWCPGVDYGADGTRAYADLGFKDDNGDTVFMFSASGNGTSEYPYNIALFAFRDVEGLNSGDTISIKISCQNDLVIRVPNEYLDISSIVNMVMEALPSAEEASF